MKNKLFKDTFYSNLILITLITFCIELIFRALSSFEIISYSTLRILISTFILSFLITFLSNLTKRRWLKNTINILYVFIYSIYVWLQIGFINYLGVYISFHTTSQFGAVKDYIWDFLASFKFTYYFVFIPFIIIVLLYIIFHKREYFKLTLNVKHLMFIPIILVSVFMYVFTISIPFMQNKLQTKSNLKLLVNPDIPTIAVNQFGVTMFGIFDFKSFVFPTDEEQVDYVVQKKEDEVVEEEKVRKVSPYLTQLSESETNKKYMPINNFFASQEVTNYNDYTGLFKGKNVIVILMESANDAIINEEFFPNFTKMYNEGFHWKNNYSPRNSCATGNNEFSAMTSLYSIYNTCTSNVYKENTYFESIFGLFNDNGYETSSYHDFVEWYYKRSVIHPNMGSSKFYGANKLGIKTSSVYGEWPSDEEFFTKVMDMLIENKDEKPFMAWLTTVTSHQPYSTSSEFGDLYMNYFKKEGYSTTVSRYLSKLKVLDNSLGIMLDKLTESDLLKDTVIVMLSDHYPYGLNNKSVKEMIDYDLNDYEVDRTPFVIYNSESTPKEFTEYTFYLNLVPTLANLLGLEYDPRLYMGKDLLSDDYESRVVFADGSWKNELAYYNSSTSNIKYYTEFEYTPEEIKDINALISAEIDMSSRAVKVNYFDYLNKKLDELKLIEEETNNIENID